MSDSALAPIPVINTARLILRGRVPDDAEALFPTLSDPDLMRYWSRPPFTSVAELRADFTARDSGTWRAWTITRADDPTPLGFVSAGEKRQGGVTEVGYMLARSAQGSGIAGEALAAVISLLFAEGQHRVFADTDPDNHGSIALLEKLGFQLEGRLRNEWNTHAGLRDALIYGLLAEEWPG